MGRYPWESYTAMVRDIQLKWIFLQCVNRYTGHAFVRVENLKYNANQEIRTRHTISGDISQR